MNCRNCNNEIPMSVMIDGKRRNLQTRKFCLACSPFGKHNTSISLQKQTKEVCDVRICSNCKLSKQITEFYQKREGSHFYHCKECVNKLTIERYRKNKIDAVNYKGGKCSRCGYNKCMDCLEFHHLDPSKKDFTISHHKGKVLESIKLELDKCILVCKNCHGELHSKTIS